MFASLMESLRAFKEQVFSVRPDDAGEKLSQLPPEMLDFTILKTTGALAPRLGRLSLPGRAPISTPAFLSNTSRGVIPHITQDNFRKHVDIGGVYVALEDCKLSPFAATQH